MGYAKVKGKGGKERKGKKGQDLGKSKGGVKKLSGVEIMRSEKKTSLMSGLE